MRTRTIFIIALLVGLGPALLAVRSQEVAEAFGCQVDLNRVIPCVIGGKDYGIADMAIFPWLRSWKNQGISWADFPHLKGWFDEIAARPAVIRGVDVLTGQRRPLDDDPKAREMLFGQTQYARR